MATSVQTTMMLDLCVWDSGQDSFEEQQAPTTFSWHSPPALWATQPHLSKELVGQGCNMQIATAGFGCTRSPVLERTAIGKALGHAIGAVWRELSVMSLSLSAKRKWNIERVMWGRQTAQCPAQWHTHTFSPSDGKCGKGLTEPSSSCSAERIVNYSSSYLNY